VDEPILDGFGDHRTFEQFYPSLGFDLGSDDQRSLVVTLFEEHSALGYLPPEEYEMKIQKIKTAGRAPLKSR
jgi:hypothetical protein